MPTGMASVLEQQIHFSMQNKHAVYYETEVSLLGSTFHFCDLALWKYFGNLFWKGVNENDH
jgi:hypothetical protein